MRPKKILRRGAEIIDSARLMRGKGIDDEGLSINWADLMKHKHGFTDPVPQNTEDSLTNNGIDTLHVVARFTDKNSIEIDGTRYEATHFLIATGARPRPLDFPGHEHLVDSTDSLGLEVLPPRILFVGGGFISFEFAHISARAGVILAGTAATTLLASRTRIPVRRDLAPCPTTAGSNELCLPAGQSTRLGDAPGPLWSEA